MRLPKIRAVTAAAIPLLVLGVAACGSSGGGGGNNTASTCNPNAVAAAGTGGLAAALPGLVQRQTSNAASTSRAGGPNAAGTPQVLKIGFIGMLAGKYQNYGVDAEHGVQMAIDEANSAGGVT